MRNVVTLSDIPEETHAWLKQEAIRLTQKTGQKTHIYKVVLKAVDEYKGRVEAELQVKAEAEKVPTSS